MLPFRGPTETTSPVIPKTERRNGCTGAVSGKTQDQVRLSQKDRMTLFRGRLSNENETLDVFRTPQVEDPGRESVTSYGQSPIFGVPSTVTLPTDPDKKCLTLHGDLVDP